MTNIQPQGAQMASLSVRRHRPCHTLVVSVCTWRSVAWTF